MLIQVSNREEVVLANNIVHRGQNVNPPNFPTFNKVKMVCHINCMY